ncbi:hypothetical protein [Sphingomonas quercus]|uniref:DUF4222 domain-containing protein n=1 Tax=Sphingomonas quercus TaxID=2842451 RepID=A0ABS6BH73_9SPHN|nr:hypothetical protein [Sphingomonas quercus]MBU3077654.1 hypothetical protein [Sphingomonas quercus]
MEISAVEEIEVFTRTDRRGRTTSVSLYRLATRCRHPYGVIIQSDGGHEIDWYHESEQRARAQFQRERSVYRTHRRIS